MLLYGGNSRNFEVSDSKLFLDDLQRTQEYFVTQHEHTKCPPIHEKGTTKKNICVYTTADIGERKTVAHFTYTFVCSTDVTKELQQLNCTVKDVLSQSTDFLISMVDTVPDVHPVIPLTKWNILCVLLHRYV